MKKEYALTILSNIQEELRNENYFRKIETVCRNLDKISEGIKNGFTK